MTAEFWQFLRDVLTFLGVVIPCYLAYRLQALNRKVEVVHKATNSIVRQLVDTAEAKGTAQGGLDERARADAAAAGQPPPATSVILREIGAVPEKTAEKVVEKIRGDTP